MRTEAAGTRAPKLHRARARALRLGVVALPAFLVWSVSGPVVANTPGSPICEVRGKAGAVEYLVGEACPPAGFARTMGYEPVPVETLYGWRYVKPAWAGGSCSGPLTDRGLFWDFRAPCRMHDYGYDLVRFGVGDRAETDAFFYRDMMASCRGESITGIPGCRALARWARTGLELGDATGFDPEPVSQG